MEAGIEMTSNAVPTYDNMGSGGCVDWSQFDTERHFGQQTNEKHPLIPRTSARFSRETEEGNSLEFVPNAFGGSMQAEGDRLGSSWMPAEDSMYTDKVVSLPPGKVRVRLASVCLWRGIDIRTFTHHFMKVGIFFTRFTANQPYQSNGQRVSDMTPQCPVMHMLNIGDVVLRVDSLDVTNCRPETLTDYLKANIFRQRDLVIQSNRSSAGGSSGGHGIRVATLQ